MHFFERFRNINLFRSNKFKKKENGILPEVAFRRLVEHERERADRNQHQFSLVLFNSETFDTDNSITRHIIGIIARRVRNVDELGWYDEKRLGIILPYTSTEGATRLIENLFDSLDTEIPKPVCDIFTYPSKKFTDN